jgi:hypothetical protein
VIAVRVIAWLAVIGAIMLTAATAILTFVAGALTMSLPVLVGVVMVGAIITLTLTASIARKVWPVMLALVLLAGAIGLGAALTRWDGGVGRRVDRPVSVAEIRPEYNFAAGHFVLDLSQVAISEGTVPVAIDQGVGRLDVVVPDNVAVVADVEIVGGEAHVLARQGEGTDVDLSVRDAPTGSIGELDLRIDLGFGQANVCRAATTATPQDGCNV